MSVTTLLQQIKSRDFGHANETFRAIMEQRIAARLAQERTVVNEARDDDDAGRGETQKDLAFTRTFGFDRRKRVCFTAPGRLSLADVKEIYPQVERVEYHGKEWSGAWDEGGWVMFSVDTYGTRDPSVKDLIQRLARIGIPAKPGYTPYQDHVAVAVPAVDKYIKRTGRELYGSSLV